MPFRNQRIRSLQRIRCLTPFVSSGKSLLEGLVANWAMDETSGDRVDDVGGYSLVESSEPVFSVSGVIDNAASVDPVEPRVLLLNPLPSPIQFSNSEAFSIEVWIKDYQLSEGSVIVDCEGILRFFVNEDQGLSFLFNDSTAIITDGPGSVSQWSQYVVVYKGDSESGSTYINGSEFDSVAPAIASSVYEAMQLGTSCSAKIDNFRFWNRALSAAEIAWLYNSGGSRTYDDLSLYPN